MCIRPSLQLHFPRIPAPEPPERERCRCPACGWQGTLGDINALSSVVDWVGWQDASHVVILPEGECPTCGTPVYNARAERRLTTALAAIGHGMSLCRSRRPSWSSCAASSTSSACRRASSRPAPSCPRRLGLGLSVGMMGAMVLIDLRHHRRGLGEDGRGARDHDHGENHGQKNNDGTHLYGPCLSPLPSCDRAGEKPLTRIKSSVFMVVVIAVALPMVF